MGCVQPGTSLGMFWQMIGSRNTVPPRMFLMVPLGLFHIFFRLNSAHKKNNMGERNISTRWYCTVNQLNRIHSFQIFPDQFAENVLIFITHNWKRNVKGCEKINKEDWESKICERPSTLASSGVMVAHLTATLYFLVARAESMVTWSSVWSRYGRPRS